MRKLVKRVRCNSSHVQFAMLGFMLLLTSLAVVTGSPMSTQRENSRDGSFDAVSSDNRDDLRGDAPGNDPNVNHQNIVLDPTLTPTPTPLPTPTCASQYVIATSTNTIVLGTTDTDNHCDDCDTNIGLPFPFTLKGPCMAVGFVNRRIA